MKLIRFLTFIVLFLLSWWLTVVCIYGPMTDSTERYYSSLVRFGADQKTTVSRGGIQLIVVKRAALQSCVIRAQIDRAQGLNGAADPNDKKLVWEATTLFEAPPSPGSGQLTGDQKTVVDRQLNLILNINPLAVDTAGGIDLIQRLPLVHIESFGPLFKHNRNVTFELPKGPLTAKLRAIASDISSQQIGVLRAESVDSIAKLTSAAVDECHGISDWGQRNQLLRLFSGPVEQIVIVLSVYCIVIFLFAFICSWFGFNSAGFAIKAAEMILDIVPYIGFFGTIFGMAEALWILGSIDISDPVEKATKIGPITGNISLAMETSQLGLIFFIGASILARIFRIAIKELE